VAAPSVTIRSGELQFETQEAANAAEEHLNGLLKYMTQIEFGEVGPAVGLEMKRQKAKRLARYETYKLKKMRQHGSTGEQRRQEKQRDGSQKCVFDQRGIIPRS
jgi:hypothetical protein